MSRRHASNVEHRLTIFLRAVHPLAADGGNKPGGNILFDNVSVVDLGR